MGPEPMIIMRLRSVRFGMSALVLLHDRGEIVEQVMGIVRARRGFGVVLNAENRFTAMPQTFYRIVVQIQVRDFHVRVLQGIGIDTEAVILRGDLYLPRSVVKNRMIRSMVAEFELVGLASEC